jgi:hypothetical protein
MLEPCWNHAGTMLEPCWNHAGTMLEPCWNHAGRMLEGEREGWKGMLEPCWKARTTGQITGGTMNRRARRHWGSRIRHRIFRAFSAANGRDLTTGELISWVFPRHQPFRSGQYERVREAAAFFADRVGRSTGRGRPWLWRLKDGFLDDRG